MAKLMTTKSSRSLRMMAMLVALTFVCSLLGAGLAFAAEAPYALTTDMMNIKGKPGDIVKFRVTGMFANGVEKDVTNEAQYRSGNSAVATVAPGVVSFKATEGDTAITVTYPGGVSPLLITVSNHKAPVIKPVSLTPSSRLVKLEGADETTQIDLTAKYEDGSTSSVTSQASWETDDSSVVTVDGGEIVAVADQGSATVTATFTDEAAGVTVTTEIKVEVGKTLPVVKLVGLNADQKNVVLLLSQEESRVKEVKVMASFSDKSKKDVSTLTGDEEDESVTWESSNSDVVSVDNQGVLTAGEVVGKAKITVTYTFYDQSKTIDIAVQVVDKRNVKKLSVDKTKLQLKAGESYQLKLTSTYDDKLAPNTEDVTKIANWESKITTIASVDSGLVTIDPSAKKGKKTEIIATFGTNKSGKAVTIKIPVTVK